MAPGRMVQGQHCHRARSVGGRLRRLAYATVLAPSILVAPASVRCADLAPPIVEPAQPPLLTLCLRVAYRAIEWLGRFSQLAPYARVVLEAVDELSRLFRDRRGGAELADKLDALSARIEELERRMAERQVRDQALSQLKDLLKLLAQECEGQQGNGR